jgi:hypothetical protein
MVSDYPTTLPGIAAALGESSDLLTRASTRIADLVGALVGPTASKPGYRADGSAIGATAPKLPVLPGLGYKLASNKEAATMLMEQLARLEVALLGPPITAASAAPEGFNVPPGPQPAGPPWPPVANPEAHAAVSAALAEAVNGAPAQF